MLIALQNRIAARYSATKNYVLIWPLIRSAEAIKVSHAIELLETQGIPFLYEYIEKMRASKKRTDKRMLKHGKMIEAIQLIEELHKNEFTHPKLDKLREVVKELLEKNPKCKIIIFANFRATVDRIKKNLDREGIPAEVLVGQAMKGESGMTQDEQIEVLRGFRDGGFNTLIATSIGEEGLSVSDVDYIIFYEAVPSEIRAIQRRGRTGRTAPGKVIFLITKGTRDEAYLFAAVNKEKKMHGILRGLQKSKKLEQKKTLIDWVK